MPLLPIRRSEPRRSADRPVPAPIRLEVEGLPLGVVDLPDRGPEPSGRTFVLVHGIGMSHRSFDRLAVLAAESGRTLVHPFDDPVVQAGAGTCGLEIVEDTPTVETVVVACGGGGLVAGIAAAVRSLRPDARIIAVEPEGSPALHEALRAGHPVAVRPDSIADALAAPFAGENGLAACQAYDVESMLVSDDVIADACRFLYSRAKLACELGAAAAVAPVLSGRIEGGSIVCVVSGGNISPKTASAILGSA